MRHKETERMVRERVLAEAGYACAYCGKSHGEIGAGVEIHHIGVGRTNFNRFDTRGQIPLCDTHHKYSNEFSAEKTPKKFFKWLRKEWPAKYRFYMRNRGRILQDRDVDIKKIQKGLAA